MSLSVTRHGSGWPLVVLPTLRLDHTAMAAAVEPAFAETSKWERIYVDLPGTGRSATGDPRSDAVLDRVVETVQAELGSGRFAVAGWSYGGYLAAGLTRRLPGQLAGLMMVCSGLRIRPGDRQLAGVLESIPQPEWLADVPADLHEHLTHAVGCQSPEVGARIAAAIGLNGPTDEEYLLTLRTHGLALSDEALSSPCDAPVCFLTGQRDRVIGFVELFAALQHFPDATYTSISAAGHYLPLEQPATFAAVTQEWLDRCERRLGSERA